MPKIRNVFLGMLAFRMLTKLEIFARRKQLSFHSVSETSEDSTYI